MATFAEICSEVYTVTNRPDLVNETKLAVKAATLKMHQSDFYFKDLFESGISFDTAEYSQQLNVASVFPRFRALSYLRRYDNSGSGAACEFYRVVSPKEVLDSYGLELTNIAYAAGDVINIKSAIPLQYALIGIYQNPVVTESTYTSWIAAQQPYAIIFEAIRLVFKQIGFDEQAAAYEKLVAEQVQILKTNNIQAEGY